jgi:hypothetical protein
MLFFKRTLVELPSYSAVATTATARASTRMLATK